MESPSLETPPFKREPGRDSPTSELSKTKEAKDVQSLLRQLTGRTLTFLSNASNESLAGCLVGLGATTYVILGRVGLVLIGLVGGVVIHATWEGTYNSPDHGDGIAAEMRRRKEVGVDVMKRVLDWREQEKSKSEEDKQQLEQGEESIRVSDYSDFRPETGKALIALSDAVIRDYVQWWYGPILPSEVAFPAACRRVWNSFILSISASISRKRPADTFLEFTTNSSSIFIVFLNEVANALGASPNAPAAEAIQIYLELKPQSNLSSIIDQKHQQRKLLMVADDLLDTFLDANVYRCAPARVFLREILANVVLGMTLERCSKPEWINEWIVYLLEESEAPEIITAIDQGLQDSGAKQVVDIKKRVSIQAQSGESKAEPEKTQQHKRRVSRAEEAMDEAMREAQRLTQLMIEDDARRQQEEQQQQQPAGSSSFNDLSSETNTLGIQTPTSSQSDQNGGEEGPAQLQHSTDMSMDSQESGDISHKSSSSFTSFDQLPNHQVATTLQSTNSPTPRDILTLHNARASIFDDGAPDDKRTIRSKPVTDYLIQVEPASSHFGGWMIPRTYADFETLHEVLRRISNITGVNFTHAHGELPFWKTMTKSQLQDELERYLTDALQYHQLAESEGMKRFLDKDRGLTKSPNRGGFWPNPSAFENMGKGMLDALTKAPNQAAGGVAAGGKAIFGGVTTVLGAGASGARRAVQNPLPGSKVNNYPTSGSRKANASNSSLSSPSQEKIPYPTSGTKQTTSNRSSQDLLRRPSTWSASGDSPRREPSPAQEQLDRASDSLSSRNSMTNDDNNLTLPSTRNAERSPSRPSTAELNLPPPPSDISDDYMAPSRLTTFKAKLPDHTSQMSVDGTSFFEVPNPSPSSTPFNKSPIAEYPPELPRRPSLSPNSYTNLPDATKSSTPNSPSTSTRNLPMQPQRRPTTSPPKSPLTEQESQVTIEILFAVINELYTLSSAWNIRRTLLTAAKTFLLRPGNPQLESIRLLLQETLLDANTSDAGLAAHIYKLRENSMPTEEELAAWPPELDDAQKEKLRVKARRLLVERGMPQALTSVMGQAASGEALGKVFDALQVQEVARGVMFGLLLQGVRAVTQ